MARMQSHFFPSLFMPCGPGPHSSWFSCPNGIISNSMEASSALHIPHKPHQWDVIEAWFSKALHHLPPFNGSFFRYMYYSLQRDRLLPSSNSVPSSNDPNNFLLTCKCQALIWQKYNQEHIYGHWKLPAICDRTASNILLLRNPTKL